MSKRALITPLSMVVTAFLIWVSGHDFFSRGIVPAFVLFVVICVGALAWSFPYED
jgi:hypothetical protein